MYRSRWIPLTLSLLLAACAGDRAGLTGPHTQGTITATAVELRGTLAIAADSSVALSYGGTSVRLTGLEYATAAALDGQDVVVAGRWASDGSFSVQRLAAATPPIGEPELPQASRP